MNTFPTPEGDHALRAALALVRKPIKRVEHLKTINAVALSLDGSWVGTASDDHTAQLRAMTGDVVTTLAHANRVTDVIFSPDSTLMATVSLDSVGLYDLKNRKELRPLAASGPIVSLSVGNHNIVAVGTTTHLAQVFNADSRQEVAHLKLNEIRAVALDTQGELLAVASGSLVKVTNIGTGKDALSFSHNGPVSRIAFSPRDQLLASASSDGTVQLHDTKTGQLFGQPLHHGDSVDIIAFSEDGHLLGSADKKGNVRVYQVSKECRQITSLPAEGTVRSIGFAANNTVVIVARTNHTVRMYRTLTGREIARLVHEGPVTNVSVSNHSTPIVASAGGRVATVVEVARGQDIIPLSGQQNISLAAFNSNGGVAVTDGTTVAFFGIRDGVQLKGVPKPDYRITDMTYSADGHFLAMVKDHLSTQLCDLFDGTSTPPRILDSADIAAVSFSRDNAILAVAENSTRSAGQDQSYAWIFDLQTRKHVTGPPTHPGQARSVAVSPNHQFVALGTSRGAYINPVGQGRERRLLYPETVTAINFNRDGSRIALGTADGVVYVFDQTDGRHIYGPAYAESAITDIQFAEDSNTLAARSSAGILHTFDIQANAEIGRFPRATLKGFTFDNGTLVTLSIDEEGPFLQKHRLGARELTKQACSLLTRNLSPEEQKLYLGTTELHNTCERLSR